MKNKIVFFSFILCVFGIFVLLNYPQKAHAIIFLSETWDTGTPPSNWPCKNLPNSCTTNTFNGWVPKNYDCDQAGGSLSGLSTTIYHSSPRSYYQHRPANDYRTCDILKPLSQSTDKIYMRFYVYFTNNWVNFNSNAADEFVHFIFTNTAVSGSGWRMNIIDYVSAEWPYECSRDTDAVPNMYFAIQDGSTQGRRGTAPYDCFDLNRHLNEWLCVEFMADATNDRYSLWINGDQKVNNVSTPISQANFTAVILSGWNSILRDYTGDFYIDDIVVADSYIGCSTPTLK